MINERIFPYLVRMMELGKEGVCVTRSREEAAAGLDALLGILDRRGIGCSVHMFDAGFRVETLDGSVYLTFREQQFRGYDFVVPLHDEVAETFERYKGLGDNGSVNELARAVQCLDCGGLEGTNYEGYDFGCSECGFCCDICEPNYCPNCGRKVIGAHPDLCRR